MVRQNNSLCPCESGQRHNKCCGPLIDGKAFAQTPEALMRSRYTAYVEENTEYLMRTWHPDFRPASLGLVTDQKWLGLEIKFVQTDDTAGVVEYVARFKVRGRDRQLHEISQFVREAGRWYYTLGELIR